MVKSLFSKASLICLLSLLFVMKGQALNESWYCDTHGSNDPNVWTYSIMDFTSHPLSSLHEGGVSMNEAVNQSPFYIMMPQNWAAGCLVNAYFTVHALGAVKSTKPFEFTATAQDAQGAALTSKMLNSNCKDESPVQVLSVPHYTAAFSFHYECSNFWTNLLDKNVRFWVDMPVHLDARDQMLRDSVEVGLSREMNISLNSFFLESGTNNITIERFDDPDYNFADFELVKGTVTPNHRCGVSGISCLDANMRNYFSNTCDPNNQFTVRFTPSAAGERKCEFRVSNGTQEAIIIVTAKAYNRHVKFDGLGDGEVVLYVNDDPTPVTTSPYYFQDGDRLRFVARANRGSHFCNWSHNVFQNDTVVEVIGHHTFHMNANFAYNMYKVCVVPSDPAQGRVSIKSACTHVCKVLAAGFFYHHHMYHHMHHVIKCPMTCTTMPYGSKIKLEAYPAPGYVFMGWTVCGTDSVVSYDQFAVVEMSEESCLMANFAKADEVFRIICETNNGIDVVYNNPKNVPNTNLLYSINGEGWKEYTIGDSIHLDNVGDLVYMRAKTVNTAVCAGLCDWNTPDANVRPGIAVTDSASVAGNIMYLLQTNGDDVEMTTKTFTSVFATNKIVNADQLILPADSVAKCAYHGMFRNCYTLKNAPTIISATKLSDMCYSYMFMNCTSLETTPELPADSVPLQAYEGMFRGCTTLTATPELNATKLGSQAYRLMFSNCSALTDVPEILPAANLVYKVYEQMFYGCASLEHAPELPSLNLGQSCYGRMFQGCVSMQAAPTLPAEVLVKSCYEHMFEDCSTLSKIEVAFTDWGTNSKEFTLDWTKNVAANGIFNCPDALVKTRNTTTKFHNIPTLWDINKAIVNIDVNDDAMGTIAAQYTQGNININPGEAINFGSEVRFIATAIPGYRFDHFEYNNGQTTIENPFAFVVNKDVEVLAVFVENAPEAQMNRNQNSEFVAVVEGMNIVVRGAQDAAISIYDAAGRLITSVEKAADFETINVEVPGVYFVNVEGQEATRVIVK